MFCDKNSPMQLKQAKQIAKDHGYFIVLKPYAGHVSYLLYREKANYGSNGAFHRNEYIGSRNSIDGIYELVRRVTNRA